MGIYAMVMGKGPVRGKMGLTACPEDPQRTDGEYCRMDYPSTRHDHRDRPCRPAPFYRWDFSF